MNNNIKKIINTISHFPKISPLPKINNIYMPRILLLFEKKNSMSAMLDIISLLVDHFSMLLSKENTLDDEKYNYLCNEYNKNINILNDIISSQSYIENNKINDEIKKLKSLERLEDKIYFRREWLDGVDIEEIKEDSIAEYVVNKMVEMDGYKITDKELEVKELFIKKYL